MAGELKINELQLGDSATATNNFVLRTNVDGTMTLARGNVGATTQDIFTVNTNGGVTLGAGSVYVSPEQTITNAGLITLTHGLGVAPSVFTLYAINKTAELNYSVGDKALINPCPFSDAAHYGLQVTNFDATSITIRIGANGLVVGNKTTGVTTSITPANWRLVLVARV
jgi:hypothetical protein